MTVQVKIWDVPTRLFHWTLVGLFGVMWYTGEQGGEALQQHFLAGYAIATLVIFRLIWGVLGSDTARFSQFVRGPSAVMAYLRGTLPEPAFTAFPPTDFEQPVSTNPPNTNSAATTSVTPGRTPLLVIIWNSQSTDG